MTRSEKCAISFKSTNNDIGFASDCVASYARRLDPIECSVADIKTAVVEAVSNVVKHAYPDEIGTVTISMCIIDGEVLEVQVKDKGVGIADVGRARTPLYTTGSPECAGMGFTIMESFMDTVRVQSACGKGTTVTMRYTPMRKWHQ